MADIMDGMSMNLEQANIDKLKAVFPECFAEGKLDIDKLLSLCGEYIDNDFEKYKFEWKGKAESLRRAQKRSTGTLRPCHEDSVNWDTTQNLYIEGDNLEVLKLLQTAYFRKVKMIYIDPPYNTGNDFVYEDDFADPMARYKEVTQQTTKSNPETMGRFHTNWLNMMYPRLRLASNLLRDDGVIFISIDDNEVTNLRKVCDEVFGEENFVADLIWQKKTGASDAKAIATITEYILIYGKSQDSLKSFTKNSESYDLTRYKYKDEYFDERGPYYIDNLDRGGLSYSDSLNYGIECPDGSVTFPNGRKEYLNDGWIWKWSKQKIEWAKENKFIEFRKSDSKNSGWSVCYKNYLKVDNENKPIDRAAPHKNLITNALNANAAAIMKELFGTNNYFNYSKPLDLIKLFISFMKLDSGDIVLDFFSGSATTAHAVMQLNKEDGGNRKFICVQLPEVCEENTEAYKAGYKTICEIGKERIRRAGKKLNAEFGNRNSELELQMQLDDNNSAFRTPHSELDIGFRVLKLDSSNLKTWDTTPVEEEQMSLFVERMNNMVHRVKTDRTDMDMVFEVMLKLGVQPTAVVEKKDVNGKTVYTVGNDSLLLICLAENVKPEDVEAMAEFAPGKIVISRDSFADDTAMANAHYILRDKKIELKLV